MPDFIEILSDPDEIQKIAFNLMQSDKQEILITFSTATAYYTQKQTGILKLLNEELLSNPNLEF